MAPSSHSRVGQPPFGTALLGQSPAIAQINRDLAHAAQTDIPALVLGETGSGKSHAARRLHRLSPRRDRPFVVVDCRLLDETTIETALCGPDDAGKIDQARHGTLVLDEIGALNAAAQTRLLHLLLHRHILPPAGLSTTPITRLAALSKHRLLDMMQARQFRSDLFFRLQGYVTALPPLRQRRQDIPLLISHFLQQYASHPPTFSAEALRFLQARDWPGNLRQLQETVQRLVHAGLGKTIQAADITDPSLYAANAVSR